MSIDGSNQPLTVALLVASHDRLDTTLRALKAVSEAAAFASVNLVGYHAVSNPSPANLELFRAQFPSIISFRVDENCFWACAMRKAYERASRQKHEYLFWMNDDVILTPEALSSMLNLARQWPRDCIVSGNLRDPRNGEFSYGLARSRSPVRRLNLEPIFSRSEACVGNAANGNALLMSQAISDQIGGFPSGFNHNMADIYFTLRASKKGIDIVAPPGFVGDCKSNPISASWQTSDALGWGERWGKLLRPTGLEPKSWFRLALSSGGPMGLAYAAHPYIKCLGLATRDVIQKLKSL